MVAAFQNHRCERNGGVEAHQNADDPRSPSGSFLSDKTTCVTGVQKSSCKLSQMKDYMIPEISNYGFKMKDEMLHNRDIEELNSNS